MRHLAKATKEKEEAVEKARHELEMKERKMEDKNQLESRSDPESVTSSLTAMTSDSTSHDGNAGTNRKRKAAQNSNGEAEQKKAKTGSNDASSEDSFSENGPCGHNNITLDKMSSSMSELTDSNKGSETGDGGQKKINPSMASSISTTAAVVRGTASSKTEHGHADVVVKARTKGKSESDSTNESTSLDPDFELDYEAVFVTSNVPQLIATPAGRIVACK